MAEMNWLKGKLKPESPEYFIGKSLVSGFDFPLAPSRSWGLHHLEQDFFRSYLVLIWFRLSYHPFQVVFRTEGRGTLGICPIEMEVEWEYSGNLMAICIYIYTVYTYIYISLNYASPSPSLSLSFSLYQKNN